MIRKFTFENFDLIKKILSQVSHLCHYMTPSMIFFCTGNPNSNLFLVRTFLFSLGAHFSINNK